MSNDTKVTSVSLKSLLVPSKNVEAEFPGFPDFKVKLSFLARDTLVNLRKKATKVVFKSRQPIEEVDDDKFLELYVAATIKDWSGLKLSYLEQLAPVELGNASPDAELEYSAENALFLMKSSSNFDAWISEHVTDLGNFQKGSVSK